MITKPKNLRIAFGFQRDDFGDIELYEEQATVVKLIFALRLAGNSVKRIAECLTSFTIPTPTNNDIWEHKTLRKMLANSHYIGDDFYPQIIEKDVFLAVQGMKST
jgi:Recombinase.